MAVRIVTVAPAVRPKESPSEAIGDPVVSSAFLERDRLCVKVRDAARRLVELDALSETRVNSPSGTLVEDAREFRGPLGSVPFDDDPRQDSLPERVQVLHDAQGLGLYRVLAKHVR